MSAKAVTGAPEMRSGRTFVQPLERNPAWAFRESTRWAGVRYEARARSGYFFSAFFFFAAFFLAAMT